MFTFILAFLFLAHNICVLNCHIFCSICEPKEIPQIQFCVVFVIVGYVETNRNKRSLQIVTTISDAMRGQGIVEAHYTHVGKELIGARELRDHGYSHQPGSLENLLRIALSS